MVAAAKKKTAPAQPPRVVRFIRRAGDGRPLSQDCAPALLGLTATFAKAVAAAAAEIASTTGKGESAGEADVLAAVA
eukprot:6704209-Prymnesium_polylepis.1